MSYGYFQGQEVQALAYYKKLLESEMDVGVRTDLQMIIDQLEKIVGDETASVFPGETTLHNASAA